MAHPAAKPDMRYAEWRKETFASSDFEGNKVWTPIKLSRAGFFFDPTERRPDRLTCFYCGTSTSYGIYLPEDDPFEVHFKLANHCPWIIAQYRAREWKLSQARNQQSGAVRRTKREKAGRGTLHPEMGLSSTPAGDGSASGPFPPESDEMHKARLDTFGDWWPLERKKGFESCSKETMARAGLVYVGENSSDDSVECMYCGCELGDWDAGDDPWAEHERRKKDVCPFVIRTKAAKGSNSTKADASEVQSKKPPQLASRAERPAPQGGLDTVWDPTDLEEEENVPPKAKATKSRKGGATRAKKSDKARAGDDDVEAGDVADVVEVEKPKGKRSAKAPKRRTKKAEEDVEIERMNGNPEEDATVKPKSKRTKSSKTSRTKKATKGMESGDEGERDEPDAEFQMDDVQPTQTESVHDRLMDDAQDETVKDVSSQQSDKVVEHQIAEMPVDVPDSHTSLATRANDDNVHIDDLSARLFADDSAHIEGLIEPTEHATYDVTADIPVAVAAEPSSVPVDAPTTPRRGELITSEPGSPSPRKRPAADAFDLKSQAADGKSKRRPVGGPTKRAQDDSVELSGVKNVNESQLDDIVDDYFEFESSEQVTLDHQSMSDEKNDSVTKMDDLIDRSVTHSFPNRSLHSTSVSRIANLAEASGVSDQHMSFSKRPSRIVVQRASRATVIDPLSGIMDELSSIAEELMDNEEDDDLDSEEITKKMEAALLCLQGKTEEAEMSFQLSERIRESRESSANVRDADTLQRSVGHKDRDIAEVAPSADRTILLTNRQLSREADEGEGENSMIPGEVEATPQRSVVTKDVSIIAPSADRTVLLRTAEFNDEQMAEDRESDVELPEITPQRSIGTKDGSVVAPSADRTILLANRIFYQGEDADHEGGDEDNDNSMQEDETPTIMHVKANDLKEGTEHSDNKGLNEEDECDDNICKDGEAMDEDHGTVEYPSPNPVSIPSTPAQLNGHSLLAAAETTPRQNRSVLDLNSVADILKILMSPIPPVVPKLSKDDQSHKSLEDGDLRAWLGEERMNMTVGEFIEWVTREQEKRVREEGERMVLAFEKEAAKARAILERALEEQNA